MDKWKYTFGAIIRELRCENYGLISEFVQPQYFSWNYIGHNLLGKMSNDVNKAIHRANLITMVKFVSAAACKDTAEMVKKIFRSLKPGALVLFIDNDAGGFYKVVVKGAQDCDMVTVFGPLIHERYTNVTFNVQRFGYTPCLETTVTVHMWMKPNYNRPDILSAANLGNITNNLSQYNISNTNVYVHESNNFNVPHNNPRRNQRRQNTGNRSSCLPVQRQPQYNRLHDDTSDGGYENVNEEENDIDCNNCCVIS